MIDLLKWKLDVILKVIEILFMKTTYIDDFVATFNNDRGVDIFQLVWITILQKFPLKDSMMF